MKNLLGSIIALFAVVFVSNAALFEDNFDNHAGGDGGGEGVFAKQWVVEFGPWGGAGTESQPQQPSPHSNPNWCYFQTKAAENTAIHIDTEISLKANTDYKIEFLQGTRSNTGNSASLTVEIWSGNPTTGGIFLDSATSASPATGTTSLKSYILNSGASASGHLYLRFETSYTSGANWEQHLIDTLSIEREPLGVAVRTLRQRTPIMGWSSGNEFGTNIDEQIIRGQADFMVSSGMKAVGYRYINTDEGYFGGRDGSGVLLCDSTKFPAGMPALADYIHSMGLKAGIYSDAGESTCGGVSGSDPLGVGVGLYNHDLEDLTLMLDDWGYDFIKVDWCGGEHLSLNKKTRYMEIGRIVRALRPDAFYNICCWEYPGLWAKHAADSWRISGDIPTDFDSMIGVVDICEPLWIHCGPGHFNDMNMLEVGRGMSEDEDKAHFSMWCMMNSPLLAGNDLRSMTQTTIDILTNPELIALNQDLLCYQARRLRDDGNLELWAKPLVKMFDGDVAITLLNRSSTAQDISFNLSEVGIDASAGYSIRDLWQYQTLSESTTASLQTFNVPSHGVVVLRIKGQSTSNHPFSKPTRWTYSEWAAEMGLTPDNWDPMGDPDGDNVCNLSEFAFEDYNPLISNAGIPLIGKLRNDKMEVYFRLMNTDEATVTPYYKYDTMGTDGWNEVIDGQDSLSYTNDLLGSRITVQSSTNQSLFVRLQTSLNESITPVPNLSFEDSAISSGSWSRGNPSGWVFTGASGGIENVASSSRYGLPADFGVSPNKLDGQGGAGDQVAYINVPDTPLLSSANSGVVATIRPDMIYTLTVAFGQRSSGVQLPDGEIGLATLSTNLGTFSAFQGDTMTTGFHDITYTWTSPGVGDPLIGQALRIKMLFTYNASVGGNQQAQFDKIRFTERSIHTPIPSIDLSGNWDFQLGALAAANTYAPDPSPLSIPSNFADTISLPGTTDERHKGIQTTERVVGTYSRRYWHIGRAWYQRTFDIPTGWENKDVELFIERVLWKSTVYVDGIEKGNYDSLSAPHIYNLGNLSSGTHTLTLCVDNSMIHNIGDKSHSYSENMQTIWNGMLGRMELNVLPAVRINAVRSDINPSGSNLGSLLVTVENSTPNPLAYTIDAQFSANGEQQTAFNTATLQPGIQQINLPLPANLERWDEFDKNLYQTLVTVNAQGGSQDTWQSQMGFCSPGSNGTNITINTRPVFMRGNLDNCHFPLTGHPPMDKAGWTRVWNIYKQFGLNQVRFHSWCPPEAAFAAADEVGIYLQPEAGVWIDGWMKSRVPSSPDGISDTNPTVRDYVGREMKRIVDAYGHHPSFVMFCIGNELGSSDFTVLGQLVEQTRLYDGGSRLYSTSTARVLQANIDDFFVSHRNPRGMMRGLRGDRTNWDYNSVKSGAPTTPMILHELGQWPIYPDWNEINKYTGVVEARNFEHFKQSAIANNLLGQNMDFHHATGRFSVRIYKAEIESALRSITYGGFSMLGLQDYMGQGEATIGILDMFYDLKSGTITPAEYREFCNEVVPLARFSKYTWCSGETLTADIQISNYSKSDITQTVKWELISNQDVLISDGEFTSPNIPRSTLSDIGTISVPITTTQAIECKLIVEIPGTEYRNSWPIWLYPANASTTPDASVVVTNSLQQVNIDSLNAGGTVVLMASGNMMANNSRQNNFLPVYWSQGWFPGQKRTLGLLCDPSHPLFDNFPTESFCDWQWHDIVNSSSSMILNDLPADYRPIVQPIDDFHINNRFGTIFETSFGQGKLLICTYPLQNNLDNAACKQLYSALLDYAASAAFNPTQNISTNWITTNFDNTGVVIPDPQPPVGTGNAAIWVKVADNVVQERTNITYTPALDQVPVQNTGYSYTITAAGAWKDSNYGSFVFGQELTLTIDLPSGIEGSLYVRFNDANNNGRSGTLLFENRTGILKNHNNSDGAWVEFVSMREDALDNKLFLKANVTSGPNLQIDEFIFIPLGN